MAGCHTAPTCCGHLQLATAASPLGKRLSLPMMPVVSPASQPGCLIQVLSWDPRSDNRYAARSPPLPTMSCSSDQISMTEDIVGEILQPTRARVEPHQLCRSCTRFKDFVCVSIYLTRSARLCASKATWCHALFVVRMVAAAYPFLR